MSYRFNEALSGRSSPMLFGQSTSFRAQLVLPTFEIANAF